MKTQDHFPFAPEDSDEFKHPLQEKVDELERQVKENALTLKNVKEINKPKKMSTVKEIHNVIRKDDTPTLIVGGHRNRSHHLPLSGQVLLCAFFIGLKQ